LGGDFTVKVGREDILKPTFGDDSLHEIGNDKGVRVVNFVISKSLIAKSTTFPHCNIHKFMWTSPLVKAHNQVDHILLGRRPHSSELDVRSLRRADCDTYHHLVVTNLGRG
jgi:hypothetical protein